MSKLPRRGVKADPPRKAKPGAKTKRRDEAGAKAAADGSSADRIRKDRPRGPKMPKQARREAILKAALSVFAEHGFEAARLDDVAERAGVAKGTLYLYFEHKEALFEALVRSAVTPILDQLTLLSSASAASPLDVIEQLYAIFVREVLQTDRKLVLRLILAEAPRFPTMARFYHREVVSRGLPLLKALATAGAADGSIATGGPAHFPQLLIAPLLVAAVWDSLFSSIEPLDVRGLLRAQLEVLAGKRRTA